MTCAHPTQSRAALRKIVLRGVACLALCLITSAAARAVNPVAQENARAGTSAWQLSNPATNREIEGYASLTSVNRGGQITLFVNTAEAAYTIEVYRMGWYGGAGARLALGPIQRTGTAQPTPTPDPVTGLIECRWTNGYLLTTNNTADPTDWASGYYLAKLTAGTSGKQSYIIFVVRDDARTSDYLVQSSVTTFQAYNNWGGKSLYGWNSTNSDPARKVSFNRPYAASPNAAAGYGVGAGEFLANVQPGPAAYSGISSAGWEYNMARFLEREGYDVTYATNVDTHANPTLLNTHKAFLSVGHDEYWSWEMRANIEAARDRGVGLGFFSANVCYWQIRFENSPANGASNRTVVAYKATAATEDPLATDADTTNDKFITTQWRNNPVKPPEEAFVGVMYAADPVDADIVIEDASQWACANTGLRNGDHLPGLLGYEVDQMFVDYPAGTARVATSPYVKNGVTSNSHMVSYTAASGASVFATGSIQWAWGLDDYNAPALRTSRLSPAAQQMTRNVLARLAGLPAPPPPPTPTPTPTPAPVTLVFGDDFNDNLRDALKWTLGTIQGAIFSGPAAWDSAIPAREQNARLEITPRVNVAGDHYNGYVSALGWNMTGASASVETISVAAGGATDTQLAVCLDSQNFYMIVYESGWLYFQEIVGGARTSFNAQYDPVKHRFWRIRHDPASDTVVFETSADRLTWVVQRAVARRLALTSMKIEMSAGTWRAETSTGTTVFDNFRLEAPGGSPTPTPTPTPTPSPTPTPTPTPTPANKPPVANPGGPYTGTTGTAITFDGSRSSDPDGSVSTYHWDFGDGTTATTVKPTKTYSTAKTYTVRLTVTDNKGATASATTTATIELPPPAAPTNLNATALDGSKIRLTWQDNSTGETGFKIERWNPSTGAFAQIATVGKGVITYTDGGRARSTTYYYRVRAYNAGGDSAYSNIDSAKTF
jgi:PKD repeat protein